jgi:CHASE2 domain-containing sensor protein/signal transduction histidine kinase
MRKSEWQEKLIGVFYALVIAVGITVLSFFEAIALLDEWAYDIFERLALNPQAQTKVLLVEAPTESRDKDDKTWLKLLDILEQKNAKQVVFTFMPERVSRTFYCRAKQYGNVFFARSLQRDPLDGTTKLNPLPKNASACDINVGVVDIPPHTHGIHRQQYAGFQIDGQTYPALEVVAAQHFLGTSEFKAERSGALSYLFGTPENFAKFRVHFGGVFDELPKLKLERILAGGLVSELVEQRSVLIGFARPNEVPGLHTPLAMTHDVMISISEYHALALNTLLTDGRITTLNIKVEFMLLFVLLVMSFFIYQWVSINRSLRVTFFMVCAYTVSAWGLYHYAHIWLPLVEMIIAQGLLYWFDFKHKVVKADTSMREMLVDSSFKLEDRINSESFATDEYWSQVVVMLHDTLALNRLIILEWKPGTNHVKELKALHCSLADIDKLQRHYNSKPYSTAVRKKGAIQLNQALLKSTDLAEEQYLVPLFFGGEVQGFWVLAVEPTKRHNLFEERLTDFANPLGESLYHRQQWLLRTQADKSRLMRYFKFESGDLPYRALDKSITALEQRLSVLENIMEGIETPTILYDVFGTVLQINQSMKDMSQTFGLTPQKMSALGFLVDISQMEMETARQYVRHILFEQGKIVQQVTLTKPIERVFILNMQLFYYHDMVEGRELKRKQGILCQLVDVSKMKLQSTLKEQVAERLIFQFRNDMQSILTASKLLTNDQASEAQKRMVAGILQDKVDNHLKILNEVEEQLNVQMDAIKTTTVETYPVDAKQPVFEAMESLAEAAVERQVKLQSDLPALVSLVFAAPNELASIIASMLALLIDDAIENTEISIDMEERDKVITYTLKNSGFGIPNERLQQYLFSQEIEISEKFKGIRHAIDVVKIWKGTLKGESQVGTGMSFELRLRSFI